MGDNKVKEFYKNEKILNKKPAEEKKQPTKPKKGKKGGKDEAKAAAPVQDENKAANEPKKVDDKKTTEGPSATIKSSKDIVALSRSEGVIKARDDLL